LTVIVRRTSNDSEFLITKHKPPPKFNDSEYDSYQDSDLWDLPSVELSRRVNNPGSGSAVRVEVEDASLLDFLSDFDVDSAIGEVLRLVGLGEASDIKWSLSKIVLEPEFGPEIPFKTVFIAGATEYPLADHCKWVSYNDCQTLLQEAKPQNDRIGPLVVIGVLNDSNETALSGIAPNLRYQQEYPPGIKLIPMRSRTMKPFRTTNLVVFFNGNSHENLKADEFVASGDALIVDPGCSSAMHRELDHVISSLPRKLVVFVTHHHHDHVDGLSIVQRCNPEAVLMAHENTFRRIREGDWTSKHILVKGSEEISIGGKLLKVIAAQGHTDGHLGLLHVATNSLIAGDHCVGHGSAVLDITGGGNMSDYFRTTYKFMELSPHILIPMHGRVNMWPKHMLCGYLQNRRNRESTILKAIESGARTLFDIVAYTYAGIDRSLWIHASSNVRLHVEHLALQNKLPEDFSQDNFNASIVEF
ncbi:hypothetical protein M569_01707, partial [Genlisea aurea]